MRHDSKCIRSDGDWLCSGDCKVDDERERRAMRNALVSLVGALASLKIDGPSGAYNPPNGATCAAIFAALAAARAALKGKE